MSDKDYSGTIFEGKTYDELIEWLKREIDDNQYIGIKNADLELCKEGLERLLQASKDDCEKKDNQIKILKEKTLIYHSCKTLIDENTALKQQLGISVEALEQVKENCIIGESLDATCDIAKTALEKLKN